MYKPETDGIDHINVYSKGKTKLGLFLTNFSHSPFECEDGKFASVEGYWYWLSTHDDGLRDLYGFNAKEYGKSCLAEMDSNYTTIRVPDFNDKICRAIEIKVLNSPYLEEFKNSTLPFDHYYVYGNRVVRPTQYKWIMDFLEQLRKELTIL